MWLEARCATIGVQIPRRFTIELVERFGEACTACHVPMDRFARHVDHIVALFKGGDSEIENLMLWCPECDRTKAALSPVGLLAILKRRRREARGSGLIDC